MQSIHDNKYVVALLGGKSEVAKVKLDAMKTSRAAIAAQKRGHKAIERALDEMAEEQAERDAEEAPCTCLCTEDGDIAGIVDAVMYGGEC